MRAAFLNKHTGPEGLIVDKLPRPSPAPGEVLVKVHATAVTPTELDWFPTFKTQNSGPRPFPIVLSHEFSGVIAEMGEAVTGLSVGDPIFGMNDWFVNGAQAEYCVAPATAVTPRPRSLEDTEAAVVPISALTAWQGLIERCRLKTGERVLIHGGAGGVGVFAVQLARWRGAHVIATASTHNLDFVRGLGAEQVIDYKTTPFETIARNIDVVFDAVGGQTLDRSWGVLGPAGRLVTIAAQSEAPNDSRVRDAFFIVEPNQRQLAEIGQLVDSGKLRVFVEAVFELDQVREAYAQARRGGMRGKIVLKVTDGS